jgi:hypothetical protein
MKILCCALLLTASVALVMLGCSDNTAPIVSPADKANSTGYTPSLTKSNPATVFNPTSFSLHGGVTYFTYAKKTKEILQFVTNDAEGTLELLEANGIRLTLTETNLGRTAVLEGKLTPGGVVKMTYVNPPADVLRQIVQGHSGCTIAGDFAVYHGTFDGNRMLADMAFNSMCAVEWPPNDIFPTPVDGPVHWKWTIDLTVND